jgi:DNA-binding NarL/FixJ family response regulator
VAWPQRYVGVFGALVDLERQQPGGYGSLLGGAEPVRPDRAHELGRALRTLGSACELPTSGGGPGAAPDIEPSSLLVTQLSERELQVLQLLAAGKPNKEIADELDLALNTIKRHVTHIFEKLGAANRTEATARARELGLLP